MKLIKPPPPDPALEPFDNGVGELRRDGELMGHVATIRSSFWSPSSPLRREPWIWYIVAWADGTRERSAEDYPPGFYAVNEMLQGYLDVVGAGARDGRYEFAWLPKDEALATRERLGITDADF